MRTHFRKWLAAALAVACIGGSTSALHAEEKKVSILMDWVFQITHAPFLLAEQHGYFQQEGVKVRIDSGKGSTYAAVNTASGVYDFGWGDAAAMIKFSAENPGKRLVIVYQSFDETPLAITTLKKSGIKSPSDLDGKRVAGAPGTAGFDTIGILLKAAGAEDVKIEWLPVAADLYAPLLKQGKSDASSGFTTSQAPVLLTVGIKRDDIRIMRFSEFGVDLYGPALFTTKEYAEKHPDTVRAVVRALNRGTVEFLEHPEEGLKALRARDRMVNDEVETFRMELVRGHMLTQHVLLEGLSTVKLARMQRTINQVFDAYGMPVGTLSATSIYTDAFLPPVNERRVNITQ